MASPVHATLVVLLEHCRGSPSDFLPPSWPVQSSVSPTPAASVTTITIATAPTLEGAGWARYSVLTLTTRSEDYHSPRFTANEPEAQRNERAQGHTAGKRGNWDLKTKEFLTTELLKYKSALVLLCSERFRSPCPSQRNTQSLSNGLCGSHRICLCLPHPTSPPHSDRAVPLAWVPSLPSLPAQFRSLSNPAPRSPPL